PCGPDQVIALADPNSPPLQWAKREDIGRHEKEWELAQATKIYWPDGALAGRVMNTHRYLAAPAAQGERACVEARVGTATKAALQLCAASEAFVEREPPVRTAGIDPGVRQILEEAGMLGEFSDAELEAVFGGAGIFGAPDTANIWGGDSMLGGEPSEYFGYDLGDSLEGMGGGGGFGEINALGGLNAGASGSDDDDDDDDD